MGGGSKEQRVSIASFIPCILVLILFTKFKNRLIIVFLAPFNFGNQYIIISFGPTHCKP